MKKLSGKITCFILTAALLFSVSGCGSPGERGTADKSGTAQGGGDSPAAGEAGEDVAVSSSIGLDRAGSLPEGTDNGAPGTVSADADSRPGGTAAVGQSNSTADGRQSGDSQPGGTGKGSQGGAGAQAGSSAVADFGLRLLQACMENAEDSLPPYASMPQDVNEKIEAGRNVLVSPLSVISALAMTGGGAKEETLRQMEEVFGMSVPELSAFLADYQAGLPAGENYRLSMANGIWFTDDERFTVEPDFLQACADSFGAAARRAPFDDSTLKEINQWVKENTDGMIEEILDEIPADAVMYLVNALAFDAEWERIYRDYEVREGEFTKADGTVQQAEMMYSEESQYLEDENATGFLKYYVDRKYAYAALLPKEGMSVAEYVAALDGGKLLDILANPMQFQVNAAIPKYENEYSAQLSDTLQHMGMSDAFDTDKADFSGIGHSTNGNIFISRVLHKTYIAVDERGTKAGASTAVEMKDECAMAEDYIRTVYLDRPFLYLIIDCESNLPVFIGTVEGMEESGQ